MRKRTTPKARLATAVTTAIAAMAWGASAYGQTTPEVIWDGGSTVDDKYVTAENWNPDLTPTNAGNQFLQINDGSAALVEAGDAAEGAFLMLGMRPGDTGTLNVSGGTITLGELRVGGRETINSNLADWTLGTFDPNGGGTGVVNHTGGTVNVNFTTGVEPPIQSLYIGDAGLATGNTANGTYNISNDAILNVGIANDDAIVVGTGVGTLGTFTQSGTSSVTSSGFIIVGRRGAVSTYTMNGGTLRSNGLVGLVVGDGDATGIQTTAGTFTQTAGDVFTSVDVVLGRRSADGIYNMSGGTLNIGTEPAAIGGSLIIGGQSQADAALMQGSGVFNLTAGAVTIGRTTDTSVAFGNLNVGFTSNTLSGGTNTGLLDMDGGSITLNRPGAIFAVGNGRGAVGTVDQSAGTISLSGATASMSVGRNGSSGTYNLSGTGTLNVNSIVMESSSPEGTPVRQVNVSGGTLTTNLVNFGTGATTSVRSFNVSGGNASITTFTLGPTGAFNVSGGTATVGTLTLGNTGVTNVTGGTFGVTTRIVASSNGTFRSSIPLTLTPTIELGNVNFQVDANELQLTGPFTQSAARTLSKTGPGTLTISGDLSLITGNSVFSNASGGGVLNLNSAASPTLGLGANSGTFNVNVPQNARAVTVNGGTFSVGANNVTLSGALTLVDGTINGTTGVIAVPATLDLRKGAVNAVLGGAGSVTKSTAETVTLSRANTYGGETNVVAGTLVAADADGISPGRTLSVGADATVRSQTGVLTALDVGALFVNATGRIDLNDGGLVRRNAGSGVTGQATTLAVTAILKTGLENGGVYDWKGPGISSTEAFNDNALAGSVLYGLGIVQNNQASALVGNGTTTDETPGNEIFTTFKGRTVQLNDTLVRYTYMGDSDLDGAITGTDYTLIDNGFAFGLSGWINGDYDYSGVIDGTDYTLIDNSFAFQVGVLSEAFQEVYARHAAQFGQSYIDGFAALQSGVVPEPTTLGVLALGGIGLLARRRRRLA